MHVTVTHLNPWVDYEFRVVAINSVGVGEPSTPSKHIRTTAAGTLLLSSPSSSSTKTNKSILLASSALYLLFCVSSLLNLSAFHLISVNLCSRVVVTKTWKCDKFNSFNSFYSVIQRNCDPTTSANRQQIKVSIWSSLAG